MQGKAGQDKTGQDRDTDIHTHSQREIDRQVIPTRERYIQRDRCRETGMVADRQARTYTAYIHADRYSQSISHRHRQGNQTMTDSETD